MRGLMSIRMLVVLVFALSVSVSAEPQERQRAYWRDATAAKSIFIGWIDIDLDDSVPLGYEKQAWSDIVDWGNRVFQDECRNKLPHLKVTGAKSRMDENTTGHDVAVRFTDVKFHVNTYVLGVAIRIVDVKYETVILWLPETGYRGGWFSVTKCLEGALKQVAKALTKALLKPVSMGEER